MADLRVNASPQRTPPVERGARVEIFGRANSPVDGDPCHRLGEREVAGAPANLPDALVRLFPNGFDVLDQGTFQVPGIVHAGNSEPARLEKQIDDLPIDVQLDLSGSRVSDSNRTRTFIAREPRNLVFGYAPFASDSVDGLQLRRASGNGAKKPLAPGFGLFLESGTDQGVKRHSGVAEPAKAIVPIAISARTLRKRRGRRRHDATRLMVRQRF